MIPIIAVDPGANGGIAWIDGDGVTHTEYMPPTYTDLADFMRSLKVNLVPDMANGVIEKVGGYVPGNSGPSAAKFARHCGHIEMLFYCLGISTKFVAPSVWQRKLGSLPKDKKDRKNAIKQMMAARFPHINVTLKNADALGLLATEIDHGR